MAASLLAGVLKSVAGWSACLFREGEGLWPGGGFCLSAAMKRSDGRLGRLPRAAGGRTVWTESRRTGFPSPDKACSVIVGDINDRSFRGQESRAEPSGLAPAERPAFKQRTRSLSDLRRTALAPAAGMRCSAEGSGIWPLSAASSQASGKGRQCPASGRQILRCDRQAARRAWRGNGQGTWPLWSVGFPAGTLPKPPGRCCPGYRIGSSGRRRQPVPEPRNRRPVPSLADEPCRPERQPGLAAPLPLHGARSPIWRRCRCLLDGATAGAVSGRACSAFGISLPGRPVRRDVTVRGRQADGPGFEMFPGRSTLSASAPGIPVSS